MNPGQLEYFSKILSELVIAQAMEAGKIRLAMPSNCSEYLYNYFDHALLRISSLGYQVVVLERTKSRAVTKVEIHLPRRKH